MIDKGSGGISRVNSHEGVIMGKKMLSFVPTILTPYRNSLELLPWIKVCMGVEYLDPLMPTEWFWKGQRL